MKKVALLLILSTIISLGYAQATKDTVKHILFKGIPVNGPINDFVSKLKTSGFTVFSSDNNSVSLRGEFAGFQDCSIGVTSLKDKDLVSSVVVFLPKQDTWNLLSSSYFKLKSLLTEKYGTPFISKEEFEGFSPNTDNEKMMYTRLGECKYKTFFRVEGGSISLGITTGKNRECFVTLVYQDTANGLLEKKKAIDDL